MPCRSSRFKEERSLHKCKPCLDCGLLNRFQKGNCSTTSNAVCGDCLPGSVATNSIRSFSLLLLAGTSTHEPPLSVQILQEDQAERFPGHGVYPVWRPSASL